MGMTVNRAIMKGKHEDMICSQAQQPSQTHHNIGTKVDFFITITSV
jgi:hypothetical protein